MKILRQLWNQKGLDAAVEDVPEDRYGFGNIAENISRSILTLPLEASNVVGIEGAWGSGKTSLLNLILRNLALKKDAHTHVLHISPWLSGGSPVEALFLPVATVIQQEMEIRYPPKGFKKRHCCKVSDEAAFCLIQRPYISKTLLTRRISPRGSP
ncbi:hypothetical protein D6I85_26255 [Escherichia coli]|nr:hypothetical protein [Escherichia coli]